MKKSVIHKNRGELNELRRSRVFHSSGVPVLVDSHFLRSMGCGQVDLARIFKTRDSEIVLEIEEVKSSKPPSKKQMARLKQSAQLLSEIFEMPCLLRYCALSCQK